MTEANHEEFALPAELQDALDNLDQKTGSIVKSFYSELDKREQPSTIYHFTNDTGLKGIFESGNLWCSDIFSLNDPSEFNYGMNIARDLLKTEIGPNGSPQANNFYHNWSQALSQSRGKIAHFFVCCFSETMEDLGQWRSYADDGRGFAIGFDTAILENHLGSQAVSQIEGPSFMSFPVMYDEDKLRDLLSELVTETVVLILEANEKKIDAETLAQYCRMLEFSLAYKCTQVSLCFKHPAYEQEKEYRILRIYPIDRPVQDLKHRSRPYTLVEYTELDWKNGAADSLKEIVLGPASDKNLAFSFAYDCLRAFGPELGSTSIFQSELPYRSI